MEISGGCLCRSVRYESSAAPMITRVCWCRVCQYIGAGSGTVNIAFRTETFAILGELRTIEASPTAVTSCIAVFVQPAACICSAKRKYGHI